MIRELESGTRATEILGTSKNARSARRAPTQTIVGNRETSTDHKNRKRNGTDKNLRDLAAETEIGKPYLGTEKDRENRLLERERERELEFSFSDSFGYRQDLAAFSRLLSLVSPEFLLPFDVSLNCLSLNFFLLSFFFSSCFRAARVKVNYGKAPV